MLSQARLAANAANARLSTGPRSAEGKARSARNAVKHGLTARDVVVAPEDQEEFEALQASLYGELQPQGTLELLLFNQALAACWRLRRISRIEAGLAGAGRDPLADGVLDKTLARLARYEANAQRSFYRALKELRELQTNRALRAACPELTAGAPLLASTRTLVQVLTKRTHTAGACPRPAAVPGPILAPGALAEVPLAAGF